MKRHPAPTLVAVLFLFAAATGRAQTASQKSEPPPPRPQITAPIPVDQGRLEGGVYSNDFFGFSFSVPRGWVAQDVAARKVILDEGRKIVEEGATAQKKLGVEAAMNRTFFLLSVSKHDPAKPAPDFNALLLCVAERVPTAIVKTEADYIALSLRTLQGSAAKAELSGPVRTETVGGVTFAVAEVKMTVGPAIAAQRYYAKLMKGHALSFVYTYVDEADLKSFEEVLKSLKFK